ncbi:MAG: hypothetical protein JSS58_05365 [Proteobacteria bacterium]|nr:hypothetical protein [Pseudomonadota bacterium]
MRIVIVTDAWGPQVNGVVSTLKASRQRMEALGHEAMILSSQELPTFACPTYPEIRLAYALSFSWEAATQQLLQNLTPTRAEAKQADAMLSALNAEAAR